MTPHTSDRIWAALMLPVRDGSFSLTEADGGEGTVYDTAERFRVRLARLELDAVGQVLDTWQSYRTRLVDLLDQVSGKVDDLMAAGVDPGDLLRVEARLQSHFEQVHGIVEEYTSRIDSIVLDGMSTAGRQAAADVEVLAAAQLPDDAARAGVAFDRLPQAAVEQLVAQMHAGPLDELLTSLAGQAVDVWKDILTSGLARGLSPRDVAAEMVARVDVPRWRALTIARTETLRAYRETTRRSLTRNRTVIGGWRWSAALDSRTCAVCWAMHGQTFPTDEIMATHPNCRCSMVPQTRTLADLGIPGVDDGPNLQLTPGPELFARQPVNVQRMILGPAKHQAFTDGLLSLDDLVGERFDNRWGPVRYERPLADVIEQ